MLEINNKGFGWIWTYYDFMTLQPCCSVHIYDCDNHTDYDDTDAKTRLSIKCSLYNNSTVKKSLLWVGRYIGKVRPPRGLDRISHFLVFLKI